MTVATMDRETRVFFVVDSDEDNEELYETLEEAERAAEAIPMDNRPNIRVCLVRNAFKEEGSWNYDDRSDTFQTIKIIKEY